MPHWTALLHGEPRARALAVCHGIVRRLSASGQADPEAERSEPADPADLALLHAYYARAFPESEASVMAVACLEAAMDGAAARPRPLALFGGMTDVAWTAAHLHGQLVAADAEDPVADVDEFLLDALSQAPWTGGYDLISGLVGLGVYGLERLGRSLVAPALLSAVVERLADLAEDRPTGCTWFTRPEQLPKVQRARFPEGYENLGVAHGVPGVIGLLASLCAAGVAPARARPLLDGAVAWLLAQRLPEGEASCFAFCAGPGITPVPARLAWCYGDAGIAAVLLRAARSVANRRWEEAALEIARAGARRARSEARATDACLCHGTAGLGHLFNRMYQATGDPLLCDAAHRWLQATLDLYRPDDGGYLFHTHDAAGREAWLPVPGFLGGEAGVALALLAAVTDLPPDWDRKLLADLAPLPSDRRG